jgi:hypothetical protein
VRLDIGDRDHVRVRSRVDEIVVPVETSGEIAVGTVSILHSFSAPMPGTKQGDVRLDEAPRQPRD